MRTFFALVLAICLSSVAVAAELNIPDGKYTTKFVNPVTNVVEGCGDLIVRGGRYFYRYRPKCGKSATFTAETKAGTSAPRFGNAHFEIESVSGKCIKGMWHRYRSGIQNFCR